MPEDTYKSNPWYFWAFCLLEADKCPVGGNDREAHLDEARGIAWEHGLSLPFCARDWPEMIPYEEFFGPLLREVPG